MFLTELFSRTSRSLVAQMNELNFYPELAVQFLLNFYFLSFTFHSVPNRALHCNIVLQSKLSSTAEKGNTYALIPAK